jgi:hypothetical protein
MPPEPRSGEMTIRTCRAFLSPASTVWPLLCSSRMDAESKPRLGLLVPVPLECRLPDGPGGVGSERECVSDQGVVHQRILVWSPEKQLSFRMEPTDLYFRRFVREMVETFDLVPTATGVTVTRTTRVWVRGPLAFVKKALLYLGLKQVHRYVFRNWQRLALSAQSSPG